MPDDTAQRRSRDIYTHPDPAADLVDLIVRYVVRLEPSLADRQSTIESDLRAEFGGQRWYVGARRAETERQVRVREILSMFNGRNASEVARTLRIGRATVYRAIKQPGITAAERLALRQVAAAAPPSEPARKAGKAPAAPETRRGDVPQMLSHALPSAETPEPIR
jgi:hypothetical protein